jgi:hypothetical protein
MRGLPPQIDLTPLGDKPPNPQAIADARQAIADAIISAKDDRVVTYLMEGSVPVALITPVDVGTLIGVSG